MRVRNSPTLERRQDPPSCFSGYFLYVCHEADVKLKTLRSWMGHKDADIIMDIYAKLTEERVLHDTSNPDKFTQSRFAD